MKELMAENIMDFFLIFYKNQFLYHIGSNQTFSHTKNTIRDPSLAKNILLMLDITGFLINYYYMQGSQNISLFPKVYLACSIVLSLLVFAKSLDPYVISYTFTQTFLQLCLWRPITAIFYLSRIGLLFPFQIGFAYLAASKMSNKVYQRQGAADLAWLLILSIILLMIFSTFVNLYFYGNSFVMIMLVMWAMQYPTDTVRLFGAQIHSAYFPIIYTAMMIALGSSYKNYMAGFLIGILLGAIKNPNYIRQHGDLLPTPGFLKSFFKYDAYEMERTRIEQIRLSQRGAYFQGRGHYIG